MYGIGVFPIPKGNTLWNRDNSTENNSTDSILFKRVPSFEKNTKEIIISMIEYSN